jgi:exosortase/archaeosortase family protein
MKLNTVRILQAFSLFKDKVNLFYLVAFLPLLLILYYDFWILVVAFYGFLFLLLKSQKLHAVKEAKVFQRIFGLLVIIGSFFIYYALVLIVPSAVFYGTANYIVFLFGLFLVFFDLSALKEAFTPLFFIAAATSSYFVAELLKPFFSPFLSDIAYLIANILRVLGINASVYHASSIPILRFISLSGNFVATSFIYECIGVFSVLVFSIILVIVLFEDPSGLRVRLLASVIGVLGTFALNIIRVTIIFLTDYFYGAEAGATVHYVIGYGLFSAWIVFFLYIYSKRQSVYRRMQSLWRKSDLRDV